jgi:hypothetical protein
MARTQLGDLRIALLFEHLSHAEEQVEPADLKRSAVLDGLTA